jgi:hypothetical protein
VTLSPYVTIKADGKVHRCALLGIQQGEIHIGTEHFYQTPSPVVVSFQRINITGDIVYCRPKESGYRTCIVPTGGYSGRSEPRFPIDEPATLIALPDGGDIWSTSCRLTDFSRSGLGLTIAEEVSVGTMACVEANSSLVVGRVRFSKITDEGIFRVGMELTDILIDHVPLTSNWVIVERLRHKFAEFILGRPIPGFKAPQ